MEVRGIVLATEDELSEAIGCRLIEDSHFAGASLRKLRRDGAGYLYSGMDKWRQVVARQPVLIIGSSRISVGAIGRFRVVEAGNWQ